jgi:hypothetical protein
MTMTLNPADNQQWLRGIERVLAELRHPPVARPARDAAPADAPVAEPESPRGRAPRVTEGD